MGKVMWTFNIGRHIGTDYVRDLNKIIHYANREKLRRSRVLSKWVSEHKGSVSTAKLSSVLILHSKNTVYKMMSA